MNVTNQYLLINLPDYKLDFMQRNDTTTSHKIVCGKPKRMTPILQSKLSNFVFNPTWTVPPTIIKEDLSVEAAANRSYFTRNRILIYNGKNNNSTTGRDLQRDTYTFCLTLLVIWV